MNTKAIGVTIAFAALTTALNVIKIPVPYLQNYSYQIGDIALVAAFLLFGPKSGIAVAFLRDSNKLLHSDKNSHKFENENKQ